MWQEPHIDTAARTKQRRTSAPTAAPTGAPTGASTGAPTGAAARTPARAGSGVQPATDWVYCPECGMPAWVEWADVAQSTSGPVEHVKVRCFSRHWFLMLRENLDR
ncbi:hypothetical protein ACWEOW_24655 [Monashia sp. NPDC004114]